MKNPNVKLKIPDTLYQAILKDLRRPHFFSSERIGFVLTNSKMFEDGSFIIYATDYIPVNDDDYTKDRYSGANINSNAIRKAMQVVLDKGCGCFHIHLHDHKGKPSPSGTDLHGGVPEIIDSFLSAEENQLHGIIILSENSSFVNVKINGYRNFITPALFSIVGYPMKFHFEEHSKELNTEIYKRQSFLGKGAQMLFEEVKVGIVGIGGGGSHVGQQLAHVGIKNIIIFDDDRMEASNLNRLIGGWFSDIKKSTLKIKIADRLIKKILPKSKLILVQDKWQNSSELLQKCDIVIGCIDTLSGRQELESECRRYLIPYIDIGMDIHTVESNPYMSGQVVLTMPGMPCFRCVGFLTDNTLTEEAKKYGNVGSLPQVVWPNGILASSAVGILVDLISGWTKQVNRKVYLSYDGNLGIMEPHPGPEYAPECCEHFPIEQSGPVKFFKV